MTRIKELLNNKGIICIIVLLTFTASIFTGYKIQEYRLEKAHARYKAERVEAYMEYQEGMKGMKLAEKADYINTLDLPVDKKNILINNIADKIGSSGDLVITSRGSNDCGGRCSVRNLENNVVSGALAKYLKHIDTCSILVYAGKFGKIFAHTFSSREHISGGKIVAELGNVMGIEESRGGNHRKNEGIFLGISTAVGKNHCNAL